MITDMEGMKKSYATVHSENGALIGEYMKRQKNHEALLAALKELNGFIRKASNLRIGSAQKQVIAAARGAIREQNYKDLAGILQKGGE